MKFEKPIAEVVKFDLKDVISSSENSQPGTVVGDHGGICAGDKTDNYDFSGNCL